jgi:hypothetical protein
MVCSTLAFCLRERFGRGGGRLAAPSERYLGEESGDEDSPTDPPIER